MKFDESLLPVFTSTRWFGKMRVEPEKWKYIYAIVYEDNIGEFSTELYSNNELSFEEIESSLRELYASTKMLLTNTDEVRNSRFVKIVSLNQLKPTK